MWRLKMLKLKLAEYLLLILFIILTFGAAISVIIVAKCKFRNNNLTFVCDLVLITSYIISLYFILYLIFYRKSLNNQQQTTTSQQLPIANSTSLLLVNQQLSQQLNSLLISTNIRESNLAIFTFISILGVGDSIFNLTRSTDQLFAILSLHYRDETLYLVSSFIENFLKLFYQLFLLLFLIYHKEYENVFCSRRWLKWFIGYLSILCLIQWIFIILQEIFQERGYYLLHVNEFRLANMNLTSFHNYEPFLYPLGIEFRICCFIELLFIFLSSYCWLPKKYSINYNQSNRHSQVTAIPKRLLKPFNKLMLLNSRIKNSVFTILMAFSIFLFSISITIILFQYNNFESNSNIVVLLHEICELTVIVALIVMFLFSYSCSNTTNDTSFSITKGQSVILQLSLRRTSSVNTQMSHHRKCEIMKKIDFLFLYISFAFLCVICLLTITGTIILFSSCDANISSEINALTFVTALLTIIESIIQVGQMWNLSKKFNLNKKYMNIVILMNLTIWLFHTFSDKNLAKNQIQIKSFGKQAWEQFSPIFLPLAIFFRFHSCIILVKIKYEKYLIRHEV